MRLIDADALIQAHCGACANKEFCAEEACQHYDIRKRIKAAPTIEPERKHGHWIMMDEDRAKCSVCGWWQRTTMYYLTDDITAFSKCYRFCTSCGARMDGGADNTEVL